MEHIKGEIQIAKRKGILERTRSQEISKRTEQEGRCWSPLRGFCWSISESKVFVVKWQAYKSFKNLK